MSLNEIRLPNLVLVDLYKSSLVEIGGENSETLHAVTPNKKIPESSLKNEDNLNKTVIVVSYPKEQILPAVQLEFLTIMLKACNLRIADITIINTAHLKEKAGSYIDKLKPEIVLLFGIPKEQVAASEELINFNINDLNGISMVSAPPLEHLNQNDNNGKLLKKQLWECLKKLFHV